jgi:hypothetical protein
MAIGALIEFVRKYTSRGECQCGRCGDKGNKPDPIGHTFDLTLFKVAVQGKPSKDEFLRLIRENQIGGWAAINPLDGEEHNYIKIGAWIGSQEIALLFMALGASLGVFDLLSPETLLGPDGPADLKRQMAQMGLIAIQAKNVAVR